MRTRRLLPDNPADATRWSFDRLPDGGAILGLPNGVVKVYDQDALAELTVAILSDPQQTDFQHEILRRLIGDEGYLEATTIVLEIQRGMLAS